MVSALPESMRRSIVKGRLAGKRGGDARLRNGCPLNLVPEGFNFFLVSLRDENFSLPLRFIFMAVRIDCNVVKQSPLDGKFFL